MKTFILTIIVLGLIVGGGYYLTQYDAPSISTTVSEEQ
jgi:hypothetical protein